VFKQHAHVSVFKYRQITPSLSLKAEQIVNEEKEAYKDTFLTSYGYLFQDEMNYTQA